MTAVAAERTDRNAAIVAAFLSGVSVQELAARHGLTRQRIYQLMTPDERYQGRRAWRARREWRTAKAAMDRAGERADAAKRDAIAAQGRLLAAERAMVEFDPEFAR